MTVLRAGVIGLGMMGRHHARVLRSLEGVELVGAVDPAGDVHLAVPGLPVLATVDQLLSLSPDLCVVAVPTAEHEAIGLELARAGVHTLVEKPLAGTAQSCQRLTDAFEQAALVGCVGHIERYNPALQHMRSRLDQGELGAVHQVVTRRQGPFPPRVADVGVVTDLATHDFDLTAWVTQQPYASVAAQVAHRSGSRHEDLVVVLGTLADGTITNHLVNWLSPVKERVTVVTGERGAFVADSLSADLTHYLNGHVAMAWDTVSVFRGVSEGDVVRYAIAKPEPLRVELEAFRDAVLGRSMDVVTMREATAAVQVAERVLESADTQQVLEVTPGGP
jgi:UDP-N-acetylglucosamine 3-dehydrogenase